MKPRDAKRISKKCPFRLGSGKTSILYMQILNYIFPECPLLTYGVRR